MHTLYPSHELEEECNHRKEWDQEVPWDQIINLPSYSPVLPHFLIVSTVLVSAVTFNTQRKRCEFMDGPGTEMVLSFLTNHENNNKCHCFMDMSECKTDIYIFCHENSSL